VSRGTEQSVTRSSDHVWVTPDGASLAVLTGDAKGKSIPVPGPVGSALRIGKAKDNDLVLPDPTVSRQHMVLERVAEGLRIRDLGSTNGIRVGGVRVSEAFVEPGSLISVGDTEILVRVAAKGAVVPPSESDRFVHARGKSLAMRRIFGLLERAAPGNATILLLGETGTGKDVLARSVHAASARKDRPFEIVDCGAIAPSLIESELFGHEKGAFTGANATHIGAFERAHGGTLFLDEIGELPTTLQAKLLRALEAREVRRVGGSKSVSIDVRVVAATMRNVEAEVDAGTFRQDLYFRLAVVPVHVPPLRARLDDLPILAEMLLDGAGLRLGPNALVQLRSYDWPGNVRELRNVLERAAVLAHASGETVLDDVALLGPKRASAGRSAFDFEEGTSYREARTRVEHEFEAAFAAWVLARHDGNISAAAREAKMDRKYLGDLVRKHGLRASKDVP
jgi:transcriptional regulator with GAF, ATPase, and Fis domain